MIKNRKLGTICYQTIMWLLLVLCMIPLIWVVRTAFMPTAKALDLFAVAIPTMDNIRHVFETVPFCSTMEIPFYHGSGAWRTACAGDICRLCICPAGLFMAAASSS